MDKQNLPSDNELDEVSLPGVGDNEQRTILEVLNRGIVNTEDEQGAVEEIEQTKEDRSSCDIPNAIKVTSTLEAEKKAQKNEQESDILVSRNSSGRGQAEWNEPQRSQLREDEDNVLDFESHLIETVNNFIVSEDSEQCGVDIKELPTVDGESLHRTSKIETDPSGTVFEVEPATPKVLKPVETSITEPQRQWGLAQKAQIAQTDADQVVKGSNRTHSGRKRRAAKLRAGVESKIQLIEDDNKATTVKEEQRESEANLLTKEDYEQLVDPKSEGTSVEKLIESAPEPSTQPQQSADAEIGVHDNKRIDRTTLESEIEPAQGEDRVDPKLEAASATVSEESNKPRTDSAGLEPDAEFTQRLDSVDKSLIAQSTEVIHDSEERTSSTKDLFTQGATAQSHEHNVSVENTAPTDDVRIEIVHANSEDNVIATEEAYSEAITAQLNVNIKPSEKSQAQQSKDTTTPQTDLNAQAEATPLENSNEDTKTDFLPKELEQTAVGVEDAASLTQEIDQKLSELTTHLPSSSKVDLNINISKHEEHNSHLETDELAFDINGLPLPKTALEEKQRQQFLDSLPQISPETDSNKVAALAKREYYQSLRQYLITHSDRPPVPPETYRWEDLKRAKQRGGYPWTHLYKRPLGPDEDPEIVLLLRKSQELRFASESPKSFKKVRIDDQVSIKETERYIQELSDNEENPITEDEEDQQEDQEDGRSECISCVSDSVLTVEKRASKLGKIRGILKKRSPKKEVDSRSLPDTSTAASTSALTLNHKSEEDIRDGHIRPIKPVQNKAKCFPIMKKLRSMADRQKKNFQNIKKISLKKDEKITLDEEQKIIKLKTSPKAVRSEIPHFIEKQDSDDVMEIVELDESPSRKRKDQLELQQHAASTESESTVLVPDEIIEIPTPIDDNKSGREETPAPAVPEIVEEKFESEPVPVAQPPKKTARLRREHVYEDIEDPNDGLVSEEIDEILQHASMEALKQSLAKQDSSALGDVEATKTALPLERMGSSEEEVERSRLAPISSIDSASSEEERKPHLSPVAEESDAASNDGANLNEPDGKKLEPVAEVATEVASEVIQETTKHIPWNDIELKPALKKEASPSPSDKKVTFSHVEDEAEPHREDIALPEGLSGMAPKRWSNISDHEYEPIGEPATKTDSQPTITPLVSALKKEASPAPQPQEIPKFEISQPTIESPSDEASSSPAKSDELKEAEELQKDIEDRYFSSTAIQPETESHADYGDYTSQVDSSALEDQPMKEEIRKKSFMASAQDKTRKMQAGLKNQAGKIKTKFRSPKKVPSGSPKAKDRKRFKAPEFSKMKMPEIKRPDLSGFKRPEFTKFSKPDMSKFKLPDKFSSLKLSRSKSFKESTDIEDTTVSGTTPESTNAAALPKKPKFDFSFGTYPRAFRKKSKPQEVESIVDEPSVVLSTETQPSVESSSTPQGDRGPGPVRSRWADKFSDVSYNDSEGSRNRRFGSEQESSFDRESSMERRMKDVLDENAKEEAELAMLGVVEQKQFADYDEENRVIHEISKTREKEFRRRPMIHQDSDLVSEEGRDIGWTEREAQKNQILRKAELEAEEHFKYLTERASNPDTHSTASSKKFVFEEINDDEFLLRKKGLSREFNIGAQKFLDPHLEAGFDTSPSALEFIGLKSGSLNGSITDRMDYGYDVPPPKPRRLSHQQRQRHYDSENASQIDEYADDISLSQAGSDYFRHAPPSRPLRKGRFKNSQEISIGGTPSVQFDEDDYADRRDPDRIQHQEDDEEKENIFQDRNTESPMQPPQAPRRRRKQQRDSLEKDSYVNGFGGRSVSNSYLKEDNKPEEVIVYRTEHEYKIPLATAENYTDTTNTPRKSKSLSRLGVDEDDRTSQGPDSLAMELAMRDDNADLDEEELHEKYIIEMSENDGYAVVRKENLPKPTPPARRKKFSRSPGERFATMPHMRKRSPSVPEQQKSASKNYSTVGRPTPPRRRSALSLGADSQKDFGSEDFNDYEVPELDDRTESPRNLQSGDIINKMKYRPLPPPPRPPREKRHIQRDRHGDDDDEFDSRDDQDDRDGGGERIVYGLLHEQSSDDYNLEQNIDKSIEVEVSTQTDPLPDDFVCEEFEITDDMKVIEPRRKKTLDEILREEEQADLERAKQIDEEVLQRGIQRFREANQRSASEKSRASSQAKSLSRPQTPSAILIEKRVPTPVPNSNGQSVLEASLTVQPIDDLDLEEELLRKEGLYDGSQSKSDADSRQRDDQEPAHGSDEENANVGEEVRSYTRSTDAESQQHDEEDQEKRLEEERLLVQRLLEEDEEEQRLLESIRKEKLDQRLLVQRLLEEEEEEQKLLERIRKEQKLQEEEELRLEEEQLQRLLQNEERIRKEQNLQKEEQSSLEEGEHQHLMQEHQRLMRQEEEERTQMLLEEEEEKQRIQQEKEELKQRLQDYLDKEQRLHQDFISDEHESYDEEHIERLKVEESYELKSDVSEEKEITTSPHSPSVSPLPPRVDEMVSAQYERKLASESKPQEQSQPQPPTAPRRKRSSGAALLEDQSELLPVTEQQPQAIPFTGAMPNHLALADLEVERLRVHALQAGQVMVSHLHGTHIQADELECRSGNLVVNNIEFPPGFIENIVERVRSTEREHSQAATQTIAEARTQTEEDSIPPPPIPTRQSDLPPVRPPPPQRENLVYSSEYMQAAQSAVFPRGVLPNEYMQTVPPVGFNNHRHPDDDDGEQPAPTPFKRRRHYRRRDSSSEEGHTRRRSRSARPEPQTVSQAGRQFISACSLPLTNVINQLTNAVRPNNDNKQEPVQPRNISTVVVIFIVMTLTFLLYLLSGRNIHHHHWDYFNPPGNDGRLS